ncbi:MAG: UvrD-helicase domain-containing protein, partial [Nitrosomonadales bacterium]|nr:UvrD-helicase domain-containing protein [Nitrosomonadales bacterium]
MALYSSGIFGSLLTGGGNWKVYLKKATLVIRIESNKPTIFNYPQITAIERKTGVIWSELIISTKKQSFVLKGIVNNDAYQLESELERKISDALAILLKSYNRTLGTLVKAITQLLGSPVYISNYDIRSWINDQQSHSNQEINSLFSALVHPYAPTDIFSPKLQEGLETLRDILNGTLEIINKRNKHFVLNEIETYRDYFDEVESTPLTEEQRVASVVMEDRNLLVAAAGSGKTSTVIGKIGYALLKGIVNPDEILVLAFNKNAAVELEERIHLRLSEQLKRVAIKVKTFHALGMEIIAEV